MTRYVIFDELAGSIGDMVSKHLSGQHDQQSHAGGRGGVSDAAERARKSRETGEGNFGLPSGNDTDEPLDRMLADPAAYGLDEQGVAIAYEAVGRKAVKESMASQMFLLNHPENREILVTRFEDIRDGGKVMIAATPAAAEAIIMDRQFKSQFETETSRGALDLQARAVEETASLDIHPQVYAEKRPIYGYVAYGAETETNSAVSHYGPIRFELKDSVKDRTTMIDGDSLGSRGTPMPMRGAPVTELQAVGASMGFGGTMAGNWDLDTASAVRAGYEYGSYIEAQIKSGVSLDDVARVYVPRVDIPNAQLDRIRAVLPDLGIEVVDYN